MKTKRIATIIFSLWLCGLGLIANAQQSNAPLINAFSAKQAVDYALKNAVQVKNALLDIELQKQTNKEITASALPQLNGNVSLTDYLAIPTSLLPGEIFGGAPGTFIPVKFGTKYNGTYGADLQQILFDGQVFVGLQARKTSIDFQTKAAEVTEEQIKANVYKIYYQLVVGERQIGTINANIDNYENLLHDTKEIYKNGFAEKLDVDKVQVQLNNLNTMKLRAQNQIDAGNAGLKFLMNMPQKDSLILTDTLSDEELKSNILDENYQYEDRKDFQLLGLETKLEEFNVRRYKLSKIPTLTFSANVNKNAQRTTFNFFKSGEPYFTTSFVSFKLSVPLFDGGARNARIASARLELQKTNNTIDQLKSSIDYDVKQARINMKSALLTMDSQKKNIELAEKVYSTTKLKYEQGLGSNQEISNAQADLVTAQNNYYSSLYDAITTKIDYLKATGKL
jgi:outer membrane protein